MDDTSGDGSAELVPDADQEDHPREEIEEPTKLLRIAHMVRTMLDEVRTTDLDEAGRERLAEVHNRTLDMLTDVISDDLEEELVDVTERLSDAAPSASELRIAQAQLAGWLEGLFRGIQASVAIQQRAAKRELQELATGSKESASDGGSGQYL